MQHLVDGILWISFQPLDLSGPWIYLEKIKGLSANRFMKLQEKKKKIIKTICGFFFFKDFLIYQITNQKSDLWFIRTMNLLHMGMCCTWEFFLFPSAYEVVCSLKWDVRGERKRHMRDYLKKIYKIKRLF